MDLLLNQITNNATIAASTNKMHAHPLFSAILAHICGAEEYTLDEQSPIEQLHHIYQIVLAYPHNTGKLTMAKRIARHVADMHIWQYKFQLATPVRDVIYWKPEQNTFRQFLQLSDNASVVVSHRTTEEINRAKLFILNWVLSLSETV